MSTSAWIPVDETAAAWRPVEEETPQQKLQKNVAALREQNKTPLPQVPPTPLRQAASGAASILGRGVSDAAEGVGSGALHTASGLASGLGFAPNPVSRKLEEWSTKDAPDSLAFKGGRLAEQGAEWILPVGAEEKAASSIARATPTLGKLARPLGRVTAGALTGGLVNKAQGGDFTTGAVLGGGAGLLGNAGVFASKSRAARGFQETMGKVGQDTVQITPELSDAAIAVKELADAGGQMPKVVRDFIKRTTTPGLPPLTFEEARRFASNASRLSADEMKRLTPQARRLVGQFHGALNDAVQQTATAGGAGNTFADAMEEYGKASRRNAGLGQAIKLGRRVLPYGAATGAGAAAGEYVANKMLR